jgi:hypothetical protein
MHCCLAGASWKAPAAAAYARLLAGNYLCCVLCGYVYGYAMCNGQQRLAMLLTSPYMSAQSQNAHSNSLALAHPTGITWMHQLSTTPALQTSSRPAKLHLNTPCPPPGICPPCQRMPQMWSTPCGNWDKSKALLCVLLTALRSMPLRE